MPTSDSNATLCDGNSPWSSQCTFVDSDVSYLILVFRHTFFGMIFEVLDFLKRRQNRCTKSDNFK